MAIGDRRINVQLHRAKLEGRVRIQVQAKTFLLKCSALNFTEVSLKTELSLISWILRRIFGNKRDENGEWSTLHNEELHRLYRSPNICWVIRFGRLRWTGHVVRMEEGESAFKILIARPTGKKPLGKPRRRWEDNIEMDLKEIYINTRNWVDSAQDRDHRRAFVNAALNLRIS